MDQATESAHPSLLTTVGASTLVAQEDKPATDFNQVALAPSLKFPVPEFYSEDPDLWVWKLEATFTVNHVMTEKDKYVALGDQLLASSPRLDPQPPASPGVRFPLLEVPVPL